MPALNEAAPRHETIAIGRVNYRIAALTLVDLAALQDALDELAPSPLDALRGDRLKDLPPDVVERLIANAETAMSSWHPPRLGSPDGEAFLRSPTGIVALLKIMLAKSNPILRDNSEEEWRDLLAQIELTDLPHIFPVAMGVSGPASKKAATAPAEARPKLQLRPRAR